MSQKWTLENYQERINIFFPRWQYKVLSFQGLKKPCILKCELCGQEITLNQANYLFNRITPCSCYMEFPNYKAKVEHLGQYYNFSIENPASLTASKIITRCNRCGAYQTRALAQITMAPTHCPNCDNYTGSREPGIPKTEAEQRLEEFDSSYTILEYQGYTKPALLRHSCGFIFKTTNLSELISGHNKGCPKCHTTKSKGEQRIEKYLLAHQIAYIAQKTFLPTNKQYYYRFDFFLPKYNIAIEYQGEQHFRDNGFAREGLLIVQQRDEIKRQYCKENKITLWEIPYTQLKNIDSILDSKFNDYDDMSVADKAK